VAREGEGGTKGFGGVKPFESRMAGLPSEMHKNSMQAGSESELLGEETRNATEKRKKREKGERERSEGTTALMERKENWLLAGRGFSRE